MNYCSSKNYAFMFYLFIYLFIYLFFKGLNVREDSKFGVFIDGLVEETVSSSEDASRVLARGYGNR